MVNSLAVEVVGLLADRRLTVAVAESLTGGMLVAELISAPGASAVVLGGVVAYNTSLKHSLLGVDATLLAVEGPVDPEVAKQMADHVRATLAVDGKAADIGLSTTGVAGPDSQNGHPPGTVHLGFAIGDEIFSVPLELVGDREAIRTATVSESLRQLMNRLRPAP